MVGASQKDLVLQRCCCERNLSVEKIQRKCPRYLFYSFITQAFPPSLGWEVRACVCVDCALGGNPAAQALVGLLWALAPLLF